MAGETKVKLEFKFSDSLDKLSHVEAKARALVDEKFEGQNRKYKVVDLVVSAEDNRITKVTAMVVLENQVQPLNEG
jgi:hypothetical protein